MIPGMHLFAYNWFFGLISCRIPEHPDGNGQKRKLLLGGAAT